MLLSVGLLLAIFALDGSMYHLAHAPGYSDRLAALRTACAAFAVGAGLLVSYGLILASLRHRKTWAWLASIAIMAGVMAGAAAILVPMLPATTDITAKPGWPVPIGVIKDLFVIWLFAWVLLTNTFAVVASLEHLLDRRQCITARRFLAGDSFLEGRIPVQAISFPWNWGALVQRQF